MRVGIIGLGLIGSSLGAALRRDGFDVVGFDRDLSHAQMAESRGYVDRAHAALEATVVGQDVVVLATPVSTIVSLLPQVAALAGQHTVLTDVGSVKGPVLTTMEGVPHPGRAVGGHPIAGREVSGPAAADPDLFVGKPYAIVPSPLSDERAIECVVGIARAIGAAPHVVDAATHDAVVARTSHLPQVVASALALTLMDSPEAGTGILAGTGLRDTTRLAASDAKLWTDILCMNSDNVATSVRQLTAVLTGLLSCIEGHDAGALREMLTEAQNWRVAHDTSPTTASSPGRETGTMERETVDSGVRP